MGGRVGGGVILQGRWWGPWRKGHGDVSTLVASCQWLGFSYIKTASLWVGFSFIRGKARFRGWGYTAGCTYLMSWCVVCERERMRGGGPPNLVMIPT